MRNTYVGTSIPPKGRRTKKRVQTTVYRCLGLSTATNHQPPPPSLLARKREPGVGFFFTHLPPPTTNHQPPTTNHHPPRSQSRAGVAFFITSPHPPRSQTRAGGGLFFKHLPPPTTNHHHPPSSLANASRGWGFPSPPSYLHHPSLLARKCEPG